MVDIVQRTDSLLLNQIQPIMNYETAQSFICEFVKILQSKGVKQFMFSVDFGASFFKGDDEYNANPLTTYVLVDACSNYIGVWVSTQEYWIGKDVSPYAVKLEDWKNLSYHDSCWRSDGMRWMHENFIRIRDNLTSKMPEKLRKSIPIGNVNSCVRINPGIMFFREVSFEYEYIKFGRKITKINFNVG